jgi:polyhydroxyalkanoate synthesis repressor PhaR
MTAAGTTISDRTCGVPAEVVRIKRYPNRRFYDRTGRKYVTLQEIEELVCQGHTLDVRDSRSDEDLTRVVLTQILVERHPERMEMFPIGFLHLVLRANDLALEFLQAFLRLSFLTLESFQGSRTLAALPTPLDWMRMFFPGFTPGPRQPDESSEATVERLSRRLAELEDRIRQLESGPAPAADPGPTPEPRTRHVRRLEDRSTK